ncbi:RecBCD enzyme subunit RecC [Marinomonas gallaica]|uniref:RecBCD enzyme subunit RecC n=1 Tax=Marinomonas gallaica TaxID=1806667 RepID=A0A1C3JVS1_9GAMM|nr:exodeoxyribonuclease V subunit gamma [Marinomonas gallaica]SBT19156.1 RecBCD enzyme subunit RecC [Marinomonas gallaica]SBT22681.1 RecBCD enzyme subunit RecC [Marinomonas gallaica]
MSHWPTGLMVIQGNRLESLKDVLVEWVKRYPLEPLETDKFLVQSNGIAQWLQQSLAQDEQKGGCGIATSIDVSLPGRFVWEAYRAAFWELDTHSPFDLKPMTWRLFRLLKELDRVNHAGHYDALLHFMSTGKNPEHRRYVLAERIAKLFDQYQIYRADWLQAWQDQLDVMPSRDDIASSHSKPVPDDQLWQPILWRYLVSDVEQDPQFAKGKRQIVNRAKIHQDFIQHCKQQTSLEGLPRRIVVFGISSLPNQILEVFHAIAPFTQILLFTMNPSEYYWGDLIEGRQLLRQATSRRPMREGRNQKDISLDEAHLYGNPLLASWGKLGRDYLHSLDEQDEPDKYQPFFVDSKIDLFESPGQLTLLEQLQDDIFQLRSIEDCKALQRLIDVKTDQSVRFIETHSRQREMEVLHDLLLNEFEQALQHGETLEPRDILIMAPDINVYVPHIEAVFGRFNKYGEHADERFIPFHVADQSARQQHPIVAAFESLLSITRSRFEATDLLSLLDIPALRSAYAINETDVVTLKSWIEHANIRWGLDKEQRRGLGLTYPSEQNTWLFGLRRMLLGYSVGHGEIWQDVLPYGDIGGLEARLLGQMHRLVDDVQAVWRTFNEPKVLLDWSQTLQQCLQTFFAASSDHEQRVLSRIADQIELLEEHVQGSGVEQELVAIDVIQETLLGQMDEPSLSQRFLSGSVNFATLMPMRAIPFKQVYLVGMNDGDYPQISTPMDFDLMVGDYRPGDRSRREDARYLFLEAVLSARDKLIISWQGRSAKDNTEQPPSVLVGQLRDYLDKAWDNDQLVQQLTQDYPMQPFSRQYFFDDSALFTYQKEWETIKCISQEANQQDLPAWTPDASLNARRLTALFRSPVDALFAQRLDIHRPNEIEETKVVENFVSNGLEVWQVHDAILQFAKRFEPTEEAWDRQVEQALQRQIAAGELYEGAFAEIRREKLFPKTVKQLYFAWHQRVHSLTPKVDTLRQFEWLLDENSGLSYADDLDRLYESGDGQGALQFILQTSNVYSESRIEEDAFPRAITKNFVDTKVRWQNVVHGWVRHVVANVAHKGNVATQIMSPNGDLCFAALEQAKAKDYLELLTKTWLKAMQCPLCFGINGAMAYLIAGRSKKTDRERMLERYVDGDLASSGSHYAKQYFKPPLDEAQTKEFEELIPVLCQPILESLAERK